MDWDTLLPQASWTLKHKTPNEKHKVWNSADNKKKWI